MTTPPFAETITGIGPPGPLRGAGLVSVLCAFRPYDQLDVTIKDLKESEHLVNRLPIIGLIEESIELRRGGSEPANDLPPGQRRHGDALLSFERQPVEEEISQVVRILVVFEDVLDMNRPLAPGLKNIRKPFTSQFLIDEHLGDGVVGRRLHLESGKGKHKAVPVDPDLECFASIVGLDGPNSHSRPSRSSCAISSRILADALPFIGFSFSRSNFTMSLGDEDVTAPPNLRHC